MNTFHHILNNIIL